MGTPARPRLPSGQSPAHTRCPSPCQTAPHPQALELSDMALGAGSWVPVHSWPGVPLARGDEPRPRRSRGILRPRAGGASPCVLPLQWLLVLLWKLLT